MKKMILSFLIVLPSFVMIDYFLNLSTMKEKDMQTMNIEKKIPVEKSKFNGNDEVLVQEASLKLSNDQVETSLEPFPILYYHSVSNYPIGIPELSVSVSEFKEQMSHLHDQGYQSLHLYELNHLKNIKKPVVITLDDGYIDNFTNAYPILKQYNMKATIFIPSDFINKPGMLSEDQMRQMQDVIDFQNHAKTHANLHELSSNKIRSEFQESIQVLKKITGKSIHSIAYPSGKYNQNVLKIAKEFFAIGVTIESGLYQTLDSPLALKRVYVPRGTSLTKFKVRLAKGSL